MITPHKRNRTERVSGFRFTPQEKADLTKVLKARNMSLADWVGEQVRKEITMTSKINRDEIIARVGAMSWEEVESEYKGKPRRTVTDDMYYMWPHAGRENEELADAIVQELKK
jgi:hypothetical protein